MSDGITEAFRLRLLIFFPDNLLSGVLYTRIASNHSLVLNLHILTK